MSRFLAAALLSALALPAAACPVFREWERPTLFAEADAVVLGRVTGSREIAVAQATGVLYEIEVEETLRGEASGTVAVVAWADVPGSEAPKPIDPSDRVVMGLDRSAEGFGLVGSICGPLALMPAAEIGVVREWIAE